jgi:hypothetical protein
MASKSNYLIGGLAIAAVMIGALPAAQGIVAPSKEAPIVEVNRTAKGDRMSVPQSIAVKKAPARAPQSQNPVREQTDKRRIMDGCEPVFSSVTVPAMAHVAGRCVG